MLASLRTRLIVSADESLRTESAPTLPLASGHAFRDGEGSSSKPSDATMSSGGIGVGGFGCTFTLEVTECTVQPLDWEAQDWEPIERDATERDATERDAALERDARLADTFFDGGDGGGVLQSCRTQKETSGKRMQSRAPAAAKITKTTCAAPARLVVGSSASAPVPVSGNCVVVVSARALAVLLERLAVVVGSREGVEEATGSPTAAVLVVVEGAAAFVTVVVVTVDDDQGDDVHGEEEEEEETGTQAQPGHERPSL